MTVEGDSEYVNRLLQDLKPLVIARDQDPLKSFLAKLTATGSRPTAAAIAHSTEIRATFFRLTAFGEHFKMSEPVSQKWVKANLLSVHGGVCLSFFLSSFFLFPLNIELSPSYFSDIYIIHSTYGTACFLRLFSTTSMTKTRTISNHMSTLSAPLTKTTQSCPEHSPRASGTRSPFQIQAHINPSSTSSTKTPLTPSTSLGARSTTTSFWRTATAPGKALYRNTTKTLPPSFTKIFYRRRPRLTSTRT